MFRKEMENIIASSLSRHLEQSDILYDLQNGFRERRPREPISFSLLKTSPVIPYNCTILAMGFCSTNRQVSQQTDLILLDFSKHDLA